MRKKTESDSFILPHDFIDSMDDIIRKTAEEAARYSAIEKIIEEKESDHLTKKVR